MAVTQNTPQRLSVDDLLKRQAETGSAATVEAVTGKEDMVKVTPWKQGVGCLCHLAITVPKNSIAHLIPTGEKHFCCGKSLAVVEVHFDDKANMPLSEIFSQASAKAVGSHQSHAEGDEAHVQTISAPPSERCLDELEECLQNSGNSVFGPCGCYRSFAKCIGQPWRGGNCVAHTVRDYALSSSRPIGRGDYRPVSGLPNCSYCANSPWPETCYCLCENAHRPGRAQMCF